MLWGSDFVEIWSVHMNVCSFQWRIVCDWSKRFSYNLEMIRHEQNRNNKRTEIERFDWSILHFDVILQHDWPIEQCLLQ